MKTFLLWLSACLLFSATPLPGENQTFSITIVGSRQISDHSFRDDQASPDKGRPCITIPVKAKANANVGEDEPTPNHFYVLVRNTSNKSIRLGLKMSDWYDCLKFQVTAPDGKIFLIKRPATAWAANPAESWIFQAGEFRVFTIDFTSGRWEGFPPQDEIRSSIQYKIKASFGYYDSEAKKELSYDSNEITAENGW